VAIQINQLIIRTTVTDDGLSPNSGPAAKDPNPGLIKKCSQQALVAECVEQVMEILREQQER
jgi:Family of unknown function (DUF5908)